MAGTPSNSSPSPWRDKYLRALEQQERYEQQASQQRELLTRALLRISVTADGLDTELDGILNGLRNALRHQVPMAQLQRYLLVVDDGVKAFEQQRRERAAEVLKALADLSKQLLDLAALPPELKRELRQYQGGLKSRLQHMQALPSALLQLTQLQAGALAARAGTGQPQTAPQKAGLWQRLRGAAAQPEDMMNPPPAPEAAEAEAVLQPQAVPASEPEVSQAEAVPPAVDTESAGAAGIDSDGRVIDAEYRQLDSPAGATVAADADPPSATAAADADPPSAVFERPVHEPAFSRISDKVTAVLTQLLDQVQAVPCVEPKVANARQRIARGLNWYELVPTLEDVRDLVMQGFLEANNTFEAYLQGLEGELQAVCEALGIAADTEQRARGAARMLQDDVSGQVIILQKSLVESGDMAVLKAQVNAHINSIQAALDRFQGDAGSAAQQPLSEQLKSLVARVESAEARARQQQREFEEQRHRALHDPLTELPNREAYNQRAHLEYQRWHRYRNPLSLAVCDIDYFKKINDNFGHQAGDRVLKVLGRALVKRLREVDFIARYGGEEFVILLPETALDEACQVLDKIRAAIAQTPFHFKEQPVQVSLSIGLTEFRDGDSVEQVFARADKNLYRAKDEGRNRCLADAAQAGS